MKLETLVKELRKASEVHMHLAHNGLGQLIDRAAREIETLQREMEERERVARDMAGAHDIGEDYALCAFCDRSGGDKVQHKDNCPVLVVATWPPKEAGGKS